MNDQTSKPDDFVDLYRRAFCGIRDSGAMEYAARLRSHPCRCNGNYASLAHYTEAWTEGASRNRSNASAMPLTNLQSEVLRVLCFRTVANPFSPTLKPSDNTIAMLLRRAECSRRPRNIHRYATQ